ncbi:stachyose synthase [Iris pallida]|uniref:galactinol--sucrose galactosyltransferase n=1 Tax=Iris pallida TaxID=29817 RepID=A0AAX6FDK3_IRIPA|nr:stachyose synthase [Iris pallida]
MLLSARSTCSSIRPKNCSGYMYRTSSILITSCKTKSLDRDKMASARSSAVRISDGNLVVRGDTTVLRHVPAGVAVTPLQSGSAFLGATAASFSRHVFTLGVLQAHRWLCLFRFKIWWMIPRVGNSGSDIPLETQMLLLEARKDASMEDEMVHSATADDTFYILLLPVLDGDFRTSLQGNVANELQFCVESGDPAVQTSQALESVFIHSGDNPFELMRDSIKILAKHKGTFCHIENKKIPANLDWFGWCTWDAFYTAVNPEGIVEGLQSLSQGGIRVRFLIIDDGWQDTVDEFNKESEPPLAGAQFAIRLVSIKENQKFSCSSSGSGIGFKQFIKEIKDRFGLKYVYMWHALAGYWGGVLPTSPEMKKYNSKLEYPVQSPGNKGNIVDVVMDSLEKYGVGLVDPTKIHEFYNDLHSYLSSTGVDGVKVDVQNLIETLGSGHGGRISLTRQYQQALEESIGKNFQDNNLICCMNHNSDSIYSSKRSAVARASEDFMPREPTMQTLHVASVSFNSFLLGEIFVPDWDMFHSDHATAEFHAAARSVGGCGVYVSDKPGHHNFSILRKLVLPDGSVLRAKYAGRPTRDCLFSDPIMDGQSLLKIWNLNKFSGVVGVFNCQGAGSWPMKEQCNSVSSLLPISGRVSPSNVEFLETLSGGNWTGDCAVYSFNSGDLSRVPRMGNLHVSLSTMQCEIFTVSPIKDYGQNVQFAPLGLIEMFNSGGSIEDLKTVISTSECTVQIGSRGPGRFGAYSSRRPKCVKVDETEEEFSYDSANGFLIFSLSRDSSKGSSRDIAVIY